MRGIRANRAHLAAVSVFRITRGSTALASNSFRLFPSGPVKRDVTGRLAALGPLVPPGCGGSSRRPGDLPGAGAASRRAFSVARG